MPSKRKIDWEKVYDAGPHKKAVARHEGVKEREKCKKKKYSNQSSFLDELYRIERRDDG
ncbi:MAG: hypothetical protein H8D23_13405 [Candidatus Brocadiales bacterium]|nr:hypothetical protein [Candidatus Brocadiales bacterium]